MSSVIFLVLCLHRNYLGIFAIAECVRESMLVLCVLTTLVFQCIMWRCLMHADCFAVARPHL